MVAQSLVTTCRNDYFGAISYSPYNCRCVMMGIIFSPYNTPWRPRRGVEVQLYSSFNLGARWGWVVNTTPRPLYPWERDPIPTGGLYNTYHNQIKDELDRTQ